MKNILITGGTGYVGSNLALALSRNKKEKIIGTYRSDKNLEKISEVYPRNVKFIKVDLVKDKINTSTMKSIDIVINCAGSEGSGKNYSSTRKINVESSVALFKQAQENEVKLFIHLSSVAIYGYSGRLNGMSVTEKTRYAKRSEMNNYIRSKIESEKELIRCWKKGSTQLVILRIGKVEGFVNPLLNLSRKKYPIKSKEILVGNGKDLLPLLAIQDLSSLVERLIVSSVSDYKIYNVVGQEYISRKQFIDALRKHGIAEPKIISLPRIRLILYIISLMNKILLGNRYKTFTKSHLEFLQRRIRYNMDKIKHDFGWRPKVNLDRIMESHTSK